MDLSYLQQPFGILGDFVKAGPYGSGHINDTYAAVYEQAGTPVRYIHQRINNRIFTDVPALMENIRRVTDHLQEKLARAAVLDRSRRALTLLPGPGERPYVLDEAGNYWRTYLFIENAQTYDRAESTLQAREAARAFGEFQAYLNDIPVDGFHETIPRFHHTRSRFDALMAAVEADPRNLASSVAREIEWFRARENLVDIVLDSMEAGEIPVRITHNDTKLNNVMLDDATMEGVCVIDLDTVMPGSALYDFGDMIRTATVTGKEDERDTSRIGMDMECFNALVDGYLSAVGPCLSEREIDLLAFSGLLITSEIGMRFLTDHLEGDRYFKVAREGHNLDRCRVQMALAESIESQMTTMETLIREKYSACAS
ncbi:MAG: aminoglycoside phosphotransferase family protein [Oceanipulchritudo sp.]